jgi:hypothetical protein
MLDIVQIKNADYLKFYVKDNFIYCKNTKNGEQVIVGQAETPKVEIKINPFDSQKAFESLATLDGFSVSRTRQGGI